MPYVIERHWFSAVDALLVQVIELATAGVATNDSSELASVMTIERCNPRLGTVVFIMSIKVWTIP